MSFPEAVSDSLCRYSLVLKTDCFSSCPGGWSQMILEVNMLDVEVLGWCGYTWSVENGSKIKSVAFIFLFSVYIYKVQQYRGQILEIFSPVFWM